MSTLMLISVIVLSSIELTTANNRRLERIETNIKSLDLKLSGYSLDISTLKNDVADTNKKLDLILEIMNGTITAHQTSNDIDTAYENNRASNPVSTLNNVEVTVHRELNRVRRAFVTEKKKLSQQQKRNNFQFREFAETLNDTLTILNDRHDTKWMLAANSINESVVSVLGTVRDEIDDKLFVWNQSIHENLNKNSNKTLSKLSILDYSIGFWNDSIHESLIHVDQKVISFINRSVIQHDNFTKNIQNEQIINNFQFHEFAEKLNDTLSILNDRHDTKWMIAANSINKSVVSVLGTVRDQMDNQLSQWNQSIHENLNENTKKTLSKLDILDHSIGSWNDNIHESLIDVDQKVISFINTSVIQHDNFTKNLQNKITSSMTKIHDAVHSMDYNQSFVNVITAIQSHNGGTERLFDLLLGGRGSVRLVNSSSINKGRLEVKIDGNWGTVCDDAFTNTEATVACKMLGYGTGVYKGLAYFGQGTLSILMDNVDCRGTESSIQECEYVKSHDCSHSEDVGVICSD